MSRTGVGIRVMIDGAQLDDGCIDWGAPPSPVVAEGVFAGDGLSVTWGRSTTVDQPEPSTCTFRAVDDPGGSTVLQTIKLGSRVDVYADATLSGEPIASDAFLDPSFDIAVRSSQSNATVVRTQSRAEIAGGWSAQISPTSATLAGIVTMPPGPIQMEGTNPLAWIELQSTKGGETWTMRARAWIPVGAIVKMRPVAYSGPYVSAATTLPYAAEIVGAGAWATVELSFAPGLNASWLGLRFEVSGGSRWADVPDAQTWATIDAAGTTWRDLTDVWIDRVEVLGPAGSTEQTALVFSGRITDLEGYYAADWDLPALTVTATDFLGDLGNRYIGTEPFPLEAVPSRVARILQLAARPGEPAIQIEIAPGFQAIPVSWDDVDHAAAAGLLAEVAESVDGVLWSATHPVIGPYIKLEDPSTRTALYELTLTGGVIKIVPVDFSGDPEAPPFISACDVLRDPVRFNMDVSDLATKVSVSWLFQTVDDEGNPTTDARRVEASNPTAEVVAGIRAVNLDSIVTTATDAQRVADQLIARLGASWRISGLAIADADLDVPDAEAARMLLMLLNGVTRGGQPLVLTDLPAWSPTGTTAPIYLEGGTYAFAEGGWDLELIVSRASGQGTNATWDGIPNDAAWIWDAWDPAITWDDLRGVAGP